MHSRPPLVGKRERILSVNSRPQRLQEGKTPGVVDCVDDGSQGSTDSDVANLAELEDLIIDEDDNWNYQSEEIKMAARASSFMLLRDMDNVPVDVHALTTQDLYESCPSPEEKT